MEKEGFISLTEKMMVMRKSPPFPYVVTPSTTTTQIFAKAPPSLFSAAVCKVKQSKEPGKQMRKELDDCLRGVGSEIAQNSSLFLPLHRGFAAAENLFHNFLGSCLRH